MKTPLLALLGFMAPITAMAWPAVGDRAVYVGTYTENHVTSPAQVVVYMASYDAAKDQFVQHVETKIGQNTLLKSVTTDRSQVPSPSTMNGLLAHCATHGGGLEMMTVKAGTFQSCLWHHTQLAKVPFGMIRYRGDGYDIELAEFTNGKPLE